MEKTAEWLKHYKEVKIENVKENPFEFYHKNWALITAGDEKKCNSMTISWGGCGTYMSLPITNIYIRQERYTKEFFDKFDYYTVCLFPEQYREQLSYMGNKSGRDGDKYAVTGLKPIKLDQTMAIEEARLIYVCKKIFAGPIDPKGIIECENKTKYFNKDNPLDYHTMYMGVVEKIYERID